MQSSLRQSCGLLALVSLLGGGCAQQQADNSFTVSQIDSSSSGRGTVRVKLTTAGDFAEADESMIVAYVKIVAVREATKRQRQIAEQRARATQRKMTTSQHGKPRKVRYLAVATEKSAPQPGGKAARGEKSVMIWDTESQQIVGNNVYDVESAPGLGTVARFETYSAEYVGAGL
jgi:hypothetical protein